MLRLLVVLITILGLSALLQSSPEAGAVPAEAPDRDCLGQLHSALVRSGSTVVTRDPETGEDVVLDSSSTPGDFHGAAGVNELLALFPSLERRGCLLPIRSASTIASCIDFDSLDRCSDPDGDDYLNQLEWTAGSDPNNPSSTPEYALFDEQAGSNTCGDRVDNDLDGRLDKTDASCRVTCDDFGGKDRCSDSDGDGWRKYVEDMYGSDPDDASSTPENLGDCIDFDNGPVCQPF